MRCWKNLIRQVQYRRKQEKLGSPRMSPATLTSRVHARMTYGMHAMQPHDIILVSCSTSWVLSTLARPLSCSSRLLRTLNMRIPPSLDGDLSPQLYKGDLFVFILVRCLIIAMVRVSRCPTYSLTPETSEDGLSALMIDIMRLSSCLRFCFQSLTEHIYLTDTS